MEFIALCHKDRSHTLLQQPGQPKNDIHSGKHMQSTTNHTKLRFQLCYIQWCLPNSYKDRSNKFHSRNFNTMPTRLPTRCTRSSPARRYLHRSPKKASEAIAQYDVATLQYTVIPTLDRNCKVSQATYIFMRVSYNQPTVQLISVGKGPSQWLLSNRFQTLRFLFPRLARKKESANFIMHEKKCHPIIQGSFGVLSLQIFSSHGQVFPVLCACR